MRKCYIDCRMLFSSGIGTFIRNILTHCPESFPKESLVFIIQSEEAASWIKSVFPTSKIIYFRSNIYTIFEQFEWFFKASFLNSSYWVPHYNIPLLTKGNMLVSIHDVLPLALPHFFSGTLKQLYAKIMFNLVRFRAKYIITNSEFTKNEFIKYSNCPHNKIQVMTLGVDWFWNNPDQVETKNKNPYFLYIGNIKPHKNLKALINAFVDASKIIPHDLYIVGNSDGFITGLSEFQNLINEHKDRIRFLGAITNELLKPILKNASALVFPSLYEGFGLPILEATLSRCPVLLSNIPIFKEVAGVDGPIYFDPKSEESIKTALIEFSNLSVNNINEMTNKNYLRAINFNWNNTSRLHWSLIEENLKS